MGEAEPSGAYGHHVGIDAMLRKERERFCDPEWRRCDGAALVAISEDWSSVKERRVLRDVALVSDSADARVHPRNFAMAIVNTPKSSLLD